MLYPEDIKKFFARGGALAWGVVPTGAYTGAETADLLIGKLEAGIKRLEQQGIDRKTILRQSLITPVLRHGKPHPGEGRRHPEAAAGSLGQDAEDHLNLRKVHGHRDTGLRENPD